MAFYVQGAPMGYDVLADLARRYRDSSRLYVWTLLGGLFCLWPLWIFSYLEYNKMRDIKDQVARMGVDIYWWKINYNAR